MNRLIITIAALFLLALPARSDLEVNQLIGFGIGGAAAPVTWTFVTQFNANTTAISGGTGIQAGDVALLFDAPSATSAVVPTSVTPAGYTAITSTLTMTGGSSAFRNVISYKVLASGDLSAGAMNNVSGMTGTSSSRKIMTVFRPSAPVTGITIVDLDEEGSNPAPATQTILTGSAVVPAVAIGHFRAGSNGMAGTATGMTYTLGNAASHAWAYRIFNSAQANQDVSVDDSGNFNMLQSFYFTAQ